MKARIVSLRIPDVLLEPLDDLAARNDLNRSELLNLLIRRALEAEDDFRNVRRLNLLAGDKP